MCAQARMNPDSLDCRSHAAYSSRSALAADYEIAGKVFEFGEKETGTT